MSFEVKISKLESVLSFANGRSSPDRDESAEIDVFGSNGLIGKANQFNSPANTIIIGRVGSYCGSVHFSKNECWVTDNAIRASAKDDNDPVFLYYLLKFLNLNNWRSGSGQPLLNQATLNSIEAPIPKPSEQRGIASLIGSLDDRITLLRETNQTLEAIAQALFKSWFVDFDPVRAKAEGRLPEGIDAATAALFPDSLADSELGNIPSMWAVSTIGAELKAVLGGTPSRAKQEYWLNGSIPWINSGKVNEFRITTPSELITDDALKKSATKLLPARTTVLAITGATLGQISIAEISVCANQSVIGLPPSEKLCTEFIYFWITSNIQKLIANQTGGAQQHINKGNVEDLLLLIPEDKVLQSFRERAEPLFLKIAENCFQTTTLTALRDTLLPRLISGQLRIADAEAELEKATA